MKIHIAITDEKGNYYEGTCELVKTNLKKSKGKAVTTIVKSKYRGLAGAMFDLISESFFDQPRELKEIKKQLDTDGIFYPVTSYPNSLLRLMKHKKLRRLDIDGKWKYVKR